MGAATDRTGYVYAGVHVNPPMEVCHLHQAPRVHFRQPDICDGIPDRDKGGEYVATA